MLTKPFGRILAFLAPPPAATRRRSPRSARRRAPRALACGLAAFALFTLAVSAASETVKPEWRDPEYGHRLHQVRQRVAKRPDQPLVLVVGSSRAQMGVSPHAMGFPDEPGQPLVYNLGYCGAHPLGVYLQVARALDDGVRPAAVVVMISAAESKCEGFAEEQFPKWGPRLSGGDLRRFAPYTKNPEIFGRELRAARLNPWSARREAIVSDRLRDWQPVLVARRHDAWERMDRYGFAPFPPDAVIPPDVRARIWEETKAHHLRVINNPAHGVASHRAMQELAARCREHGAAVAMAWAPESPAYRALYNADGRAGMEAYTRLLTSDLGAAVFPAPTHLEEDDFPDGLHLNATGAAKYSRWLADNHLRSWLAEVLK